MPEAHVPCAIVDMRSGLPAYSEDAASFTAPASDPQRSSAPRRFPRSGHYRHDAHGLPDRQRVARSARAGLRRALHHTQGRRQGSRLGRPESVVGLGGRPDRPAPLRDPHTWAPTVATGRLTDGRRMGGAPPQAAVHHSAGRLRQGGRIRTGHLRRAGMDRPPGFPARVPVADRLPAVDTHSWHSWHSSTSTPATGPRSPASCRARRSRGSSGPGTSTTCQSHAPDETSARPVSNPGEPALCACRR